ncbi:prohead protease/major capsid protein fusion protein [Thiococcus pfennigii]|uniref:prohead protease/major capsid protein fusion protein n=1 Tax=Thiococcus pfennigii TaxID=1057 RepID=UPI001904D89F|nr:prohead protease/major capsid protein fusion protein [Thiococcus pfennigii]MBK1699752.1 hypothetical protein [Thiococcus pfennigii]
MKTDQKTLQTRRQRVDGPPLTRKAEITGFDAETRIVRVSFSSELPVERATWWDDPWIEVLGHDDGECNLERLNAGAPVLYNHDRWDRDNRIGVVGRAWVETGRGEAELRISRRPEVDGLWQDIADGVLCNVSVGYSIDERQLVRAHKDAPDEYRVTRWTPLEISFVDIPADHTVGVGRHAGAAPQQHYRVFDLPDSDSGATRGGNMPDKSQATGGAPESTARPSQQPETPVNLDDVRKQAEREVLERQRAEREAVISIGENLRTRYSFVPDLERAALTEGWTAQRYREAILERLGAVGEPVNHDPDRARFRAGADASDKRRTAAVEAILYRANHREVPEAHGKARAIDLSGNPFRGATLLQIAERCLRAAGQNPDGMDKRELVARAFQTTSDFPVLLEEAIHKALLGAYRLAPDTWSRFCARGTVSDFRAHNRYRTGSIGNYDALNEHGEFRRKSIPDGEKASITASTRGNIIGITREVIINDDLGALVGLATMLGRAGRRTIEAAVYAMLAENGGAGPVMGDGQYLFSAAHANIESTTVGAPSVTTFEATRVRLAQQMDVSGNDYLDLRPAIWLGPIGLGGSARVVNDAQYDPDTASKLQRPNMVRGLVRDIVDTPRLTGNPWYLFADPDEAPVVEVAFLDGMDEPFIETQDGWDVDGAELKARLDFGVGAVDFRGAAKNNGG